MKALRPLILAALALTSVAALSAQPDSIAATAATLAIAFGSACAAIRLLLRWAAADIRLRHAIRRALRGSEE